MDNLPQLCDEMVNEIFLGLPVESICRFKCLSKRWNSLLSSPSFGSKYLSSSQNTMQKKERTSFLPPVLGFFQSCSLPPEYNLDKTTPPPPMLSFLPSPPSRLKFRSFVQRLGHFMGSSNGLILCGHHHPTTYYVCNPITDRWLQLPKPNNNLGCATEKYVAIGFLYDGPGGTFKVVRADLPARRVTALRMRTYSSYTGEWDDDDPVLLRSPVPFRLIPLLPAHVISGVIFWLAYYDYVAAYDPNRQDQWLWLIKVPPQNLGSGDWTDWSFILGESREGLIQLGMNDYPGFRILTLRKKLCSYSITAAVEESEWIPMIRVIYPGWDRSISPEIAFADPRVAGGYLQYRYLLAFHPQSSRYVYIQWGFHIYRYDVETGSKLFIPYGGGELSWAAGVFTLPYFSPTWPWLPTLL